MLKVLLVSMVLEAAVVADLSLAPIWEAVMAAQA